MDFVTRHYTSILASSYWTRHNEKMATTITSITDQSIELNSFLFFLLVIVLDDDDDVGDAR